MPSRAWERRSDVRIVHIGAPRASADLPRCGERLRAALDDDPSAVVVCDVGRLAQPDAATVDGLARLRLTARRLGAELLLRNASADLRELLEFAGLCEVVGVCPTSGVEVEGQAEEREPARGVQEEGDPADPIA